MAVQYIRFSVRIGGSVTSVSLRKNLVAIWILLVEKETGTFMDNISDFVYECINRWEGNNGKGFSDFVADQLIKDILDESDYVVYHKILAKLGDFGAQAA